MQIRARRYDTLCVEAKNTAVLITTVITTLLTLFGSFPCDETSALDLAFRKADPTLGRPDSDPLFQFSTFTMSVSSTEFYLSRSAGGGKISPNSNVAE